MAFFPEKLYNASSRDLTSLPLTPLFHLASDLQIASQLRPLFTVPADAVLVLQSAHLVAFPSAVVAVQDLVILIRTIVQDLAGDFTLSGDTQPGGGNGISRSIQWSGSILVPPRWRVMGIANFTPTPVVNVEAELAIAGILLPVGNIPRV